MSSTQPADSAEVRYTSDQIRDAVDGLSQDDWRRIAAIARALAPRSGMSAAELQQETFVRILSSRTCSVSTTIIGFIAGTMKSIASEIPRERKKAREEGGLEIVYVKDYGKGGVPELATPETSPEEAALARTMHARHLKDALACLAGDEELELLAEGLFDGMRGQALEDLLGTDTKGIAAARKRLARRLLPRYPSGIPL